MPSSASRAPSAIPTLSLHDALPIFGSGGFVHRSDLGFEADELVLACSTAGARFEHVAQRTVSSPDGQVRMSRFRGPLCDGVTGVRLDRKSTRLNSSHLGISYAVFCFPRPLRDPHSFPTRRSSDLRLRRLRPSE